MITKMITPEIQAGFTVLTNEQLETIITYGQLCQKILAQRHNAALDARAQELQREIEDQRKSVAQVANIHDSQTLPIVQKQIFRVLTRMTERLNLLCCEQDNLRYQRMLEEPVYAARA